jgi:hypothetical protein
MRADAGITDREGPGIYPAEMYTGRNMYDSINPAVLNQLTTGRQF